MSVTVYGIPNCTTVQKAWAWLDTHNVVYDFHDFKTLGVTEAKLREWIAAVGWEKVMNRGSLTFRNLPADDKSDLTEDKAVALMIAKPTLIRRPVVETGQATLFGFAATRYAETFGGAS